MTPCWLKWFWNMLTISVALGSISQCQLQKASRLQQWLFLLQNQFKMMSLLTLSRGTSILQPHLSKSVSHSCHDAETHKEVRRRPATGDFPETPKADFRQCYSPFHEDFPLSCEIGYRMQKSLVWKLAHRLSINLSMHFWMWHIQKLLNLCCHGNAVMQMMSLNMRIIISFWYTTSSISPCINTVETKVPFCTIP